MANFNSMPNIPTTSPDVRVGSTAPDLLPDGSGVRSPGDVDGGSGRLLAGPIQLEDGGTIALVQGGIWDAADKGRIPGLEGERPSASEGILGGEPTVADIGNMTAQERAAIAEWFSRMTDEERASYHAFLDGAEAMSASLGQRIEAFRGRVEEAMQRTRLEALDHVLPLVVRDARALELEIDRAADQIESSGVRIEGLFPQRPTMKPGTDVDYSGQLTTFQRWGMGVAFVAEAVFAGTGSTVPDAHVPTPAQFEQAQQVEGAASNQGQPRAERPNLLEQEPGGGPQSADPPPNRPKAPISPEEAPAPQGSYRPMTEQQPPRRGSGKDEPEPS